MGIHYITFFEYRVNLVLLRTARTDPILKEILLPHLSLAACRNRDRTDVDTVVEICSPEVRKGKRQPNKCLFR